MPMAYTLTFIISQINRLYTHTRARASVYTYVCAFHSSLLPSLTLFVCVCVCVCVRFMS